MTCGKIVGCVGINFKCVQWVKMYTIEKENKTKKTKKNLCLVYTTYTNASINTHFLYSR